MRKYLLFSCLLFSICALTRAQYLDRSVVSSAGDYFEQSSVQLTWVVGDLVAGAYDIGHLMLSPGVNLPHYEDVPSKITVFPNPTSDLLYVNLNMDKIGHCIYYLFDILGREILNGNITSHQTELSLTPFESGVYILRVVKENSLVQEVKIVKH